MARAVRTSVKTQVDSVGRQPTPVSAAYVKQLRNMGASRYAVALAQAHIIRVRKSKKRTKSPGVEIVGG